MSYTKYKTKGIVLGGTNIGEGSRSYNIFTQDFGLIHVRAQGIRELKSKLKYSLQNLFLVDLYLVRGKSGWHITESYKIKSITEPFKKNNHKLKASVRVLFFLKRVLGQEDNNKNLFDIINKGFYFMESENFSEDDVLDIESLIVLRILNNLGYVDDREVFKSLLVDAEYNNDVIMKVRKIKSIIIKEINQSIRASDL